jgi:hypothetical protein
MVAKGFSFAKHYNTLAVFVLKESRVNKALDLKPDRCLEFMTEDDYSVEFLCRENVIYARPSIPSEKAAELELVIRNINTHGQLEIVADIISGNKSFDLVTSLRNLDKNRYMIYKLTSNNDIAIHAKVENNGNTIILDGNKL